MFAKIVNYWHALFTLPTSCSSLNSLSFIMVDGAQWLWVKYCNHVYGFCLISHSLKLYHCVYFFVDIFCEWCIVYILVILYHHVNTILDFKKNCIIITDNNSTYNQWSYGILISLVCCVIKIHIIYIKWERDPAGHGGNLYHIPCLYLYSHRFRHLVLKANHCIQQNSNLGFCDCLQRNANIDQCVMVPGTTEVL